ncbi:hypothetical protein [Acinetobacter tianfuensis]|uniref:hypothetical protein n=1 Tax=Acinetobacter tianfuensis TaxID=2419603 RepID=UPI00148C6BC7|nr:hypothetical protein [Acinetobacter tianfuensis]
MLMQLSFMSEAGLVIMIGGILLPIYTGNLFKMTQVSKEQYFKKIKQAAKASGGMIS